MTNIWHLRSYRDRDTHIAAAVWSSFSRVPLPVVLRACPGRPLRLQTVHHDPGPTVYITLAPNWHT